MTEKIPVTAMVTGICLWVKKLLDKYPIGV